MAWFGESFANIKGQISNFTKDVLTVEAEEEDELNPDPDEFRRLKAELSNIQEKFRIQTDEILSLRAKAADWEEKCSASELQSKTVKESYQELLRLSEEEKNQLKERVEQLQAASIHVGADGNEEREAKEKEAGEVPNPFKKEQLEHHVQKSDASTDTESQSYDELFVRELEERCTSYQNDLYIIRNELMNLQREADQAEERNAKFIEDISELLGSEFHLDGESIFKPTNHQHDAMNEGNFLILSRIKEISFLWKDLIEKKATLERTVTKLSIPHGHSSGQEAPSIILSSDQSPHSSNSNIIDLFNEPFFPPKIDSFGLETILEEDRSEDEAHRCESSSDLIYEEAFGSGIGGPGSSQARRKGTPSPATTTFSSNCSTQTELEDELEEPTSDKEPVSGSFSGIQANELALLQARAEKWNQEEADLVAKLEERESRIRRLELDLGRLRSHLVDLEEQTTGEALLSEKREEQLQVQLTQLKNELTRTLQQNERSLDVREEITKLTQERNSYRYAVSGLEDQIQKLNAQLQNLHFVLESFQKEKEIEVSSVEKRLRLEMSQLEQKNEVLRRELEKEEVLLERAKSGLDAAHQLNAQIEEKTRSILQLKAQVQERDAELLKIKSKMDEVENNLDGKIDRYLIKNLIVGYFSTPDDKRGEVLRLLATVLDFNREDRQKTGLESGFSLWQFGRRPSSSTSEKEKQSLSEAFIHFLETESKPKVELRMTVEEVTRRNESPSTGSPTVMTTSSSGGDMGRESPLVGGGSTEGSSTGRRNMPEISMSLPVLSQADRSNSILKDILNHKP